MVTDRTADWSSAAPSGCCSPTSTGTCSSWPPPTSASSCSSCSSCRPTRAPAWTATARVSRSSTSTCAAARPVAAVRPARGRGRVPVGARVPAAAAQRDHRRAEPVRRPTPAAIEPRDVPIVQALADVATIGAAAGARHPPRRGAHRAAPGRAEQPDRDRAGQGCARADPLVHAPTRRSAEAAGLQPSPQPASRRGRPRRHHRAGQRGRSRHSPRDPRGHPVGSQAREPGRTGRAPRRSTAGLRRVERWRRTPRRGSGCPSACR